MAPCFPPLLLSALGFAAPGRYDPASFDYPGRAHTAFTCLDWLLAGQALALRLPRLPPQARGARLSCRAGCCGSRAANGIGAPTC